MESRFTEIWQHRVDELNATEPTGQFFKCQEVWHCLLGINVGREQNGDETTFLRPVLIVQRFGPHIFWGVPLSSRTPADSRHHHLFSHESTQYSALITQLRVFDSRRLLRRLYTLDDANFNAIQLRLGRIMLREQNRTPS